MTARALAIQILARVEATDAFLNVVLDTQLRESPPRDPRDAALVTELCYGATRRRLALDALLSQLADRKLAALEDRVLAALRVGTYQLFFTRIPRRAAVAETVEALKALGLGRASGFVNAILRRASGIETLPLPEEPLAALAQRESHPQWLVRRWVQTWGEARARQMAEADNLPPPVVVRVNQARTSRPALLAQLEEAGLQARPTATSPVGIAFASPGRVEDLLGYPEGLWQVQDEAAQLVGVFAAFPPGARLLDCCAAPGGKALQLAETHEVLATDLHQNKLRKLEQEALRLGLQARVRAEAHDATSPLPSAWGLFDGVLVDAPCTGLGTLRRHPELRYRRKPEDVARLAALQAQILENAAAAVAPGGLLVYAVCSTEPEEGRDQVAAFLARHPRFQRAPPSAPLPLLEGDLWTLPGPEGLDGFYAARLRNG